MAIAKRKRTKKPHVFHLARDEVGANLYCVADSRMKDAGVDGEIDWRVANSDSLPASICPKWFHEIAKTPDGKPYCLRPGDKPRPVRLKLIVEEVK